MPPKRTPTSTAHGPPLPAPPDDPPDDPRDDYPKPSPSIGEPTIAKYNDLTTAHKALDRIHELKANADSLQTSLGPQQLHELRAEPPPEFSGSILEFPNFMAAYTLVYTLCPTTYSSDECKVLYVVSHLHGTAMSWAHNIAENPDHLYHHN